MQVSGRGGAVAGASGQSPERGGASRSSGAEAAAGRGLMTELRGAVRPEAPRGPGARRREVRLCPPCLP